MMPEADRPRESGNDLVVKRQLPCSNWDDDYHRHLKIIT